MLNPITNVIAYGSGIPESTVRLLVTLGLTYPIAAYYQRNLLKPLSATGVDERNSYILTAGLGLAIFFSGFRIIHSLITIYASYAFMWFGDQMHNRKAGAIAVFAFNLLYLLAGYWAKSSEIYEISWTTPQCVLCLRLIGLGIDVYDGKSIAAEPTKVPRAHSVDDDVKIKRAPLSFGSDTALANVPELRYILAYCYFPSSFLVGPQFSFSLYRKFITFEKYADLSPDDLQKSKKAQMDYMYRCIATGLTYLLVQQLVGSQYPTSYLLTPEFASLNIFKRLITFWICGKMVYNKYLGVWNLTEGACTLFGISYAGPNNGQADFSGLANVSPRVFELATSTEQVIASFNMNTNLWVKVYIFKRLKFLNNKSLSQAVSLAFLAIWHGFHLNYFLTFIMEFLDVEAEEVLKKHLRPKVMRHTQKNPLLDTAWKVLAWIICTSTVNYAVVGFDLLLFRKAWVAYKAVWFIGHIAIASILFGGKFLKSPQIIQSAKKQE
ncbi:hypothetical protein NQZ79_g3700 [Umbelopsis isabellina]|nr:hypothetical protein NQZ79_g3700 [Umbelopsis isabellina]